MINLKPHPSDTYYESFGDSLDNVNSLRRSDTTLENVRQRMRMLSEHYKSEEALDEDWDCQMPKKYEKPPDKITDALGPTMTLQASGICAVCSQTVYKMEMIIIGNDVYHKNCFRCQTCGRVLSVGKFSAVNNMVYCVNHFLDLIHQTNFSVDGGRNNRNDDLADENDNDDTFAESNGNHLAIEDNYPDNYCINKDIDDDLETIREMEASILNNYERNKQNIIDNTTVTEYDIIPKKKKVQFSNYRKNSVNMINGNLKLQDNLNKKNGLNAKVALCDEKRRESDYGTVTNTQLEQILNDIEIQKEQATETKSNCLCTNRTKKESEDNTVYEQDTSNQVERISTKEIREKLLRIATESSNAPRKLSPQEKIERLAKQKKLLGENLSNQDKTLLDRKQENELCIKAENSGLNASSITVTEAIPITQNTKQPKVNGEQYTQKTKSYPISSHNPITSSGNSQIPVTINTNDITSKQYTNSVNHQAKPINHEDSIDSNFHNGMNDVIQQVKDMSNNRNENSKNKQMSSPASQKSAQNHDAKSQTPQIDINIKISNGVSQNNLQIQHSADKNEVSNNSSHFLDNRKSSNKSKQLYNKRTAVLHKSDKEIASQVIAENIKPNDCMNDDKTKVNNESIDVDSLDELESGKIVRCSDLLEDCLPPPKIAKNLKLFFEQSLANRKSEQSAELNRKKFNNKRYGLLRQDAVDSKLIDKVGGSLPDLHFAVEQCVQHAEESKTRKNSGFSIPVSKIASLTRNSESKVNEKTTQMPKKSCIKLENGTSDSQNVKQNFAQNGAVLTIPKLSTNSNLNTKCTQTCNDPDVTKILDINLAFVNTHEAKTKAYIPKHQSLYNRQVQKTSSKPTLVADISQPVHDISISPQPITYNSDLIDEVTLNNCSDIIKEDNSEDDLPKAGTIKNLRALFEITKY